MDPTFRRILEEAERIRAECRRTGHTGAHATKMMEALQYAQAHHLFTGSVPDGTADEENLAQASEMAAYVLEVFHDEERIGPVLGLSRERKLAICRRAVEKASADIAAFGDRRE